jgi:hypothetical protein
MNHKKEKGMKSKERAVLVTTAHKGVFFGYATDTSGQSISLRAARLCVYWSADLRGFMRKAQRKPKPSMRCWSKPKNTTQRTSIRYAKGNSSANQDVTTCDPRPHAQGEAAMIYAYFAIGFVIGFFVCELAKRLVRESRRNRKRQIESLAYDQAIKAIRWHEGKFHRELLKP